MPHGRRAACAVLAQFGQGEVLGQWPKHEGITHALEFSAPNQAWDGQQGAEGGDASSALGMLRPRRPDLVRLRAAQQRLNSTPSTSY